MRSSVVRTVFSIGLLATTVAGCSGGAAAGAADGGLDLRAAPEGGPADSADGPLHTTLHFSWSVTGVGEGADRITCAGISAQLFSIVVYTDEDRRTILDSNAVSCATGSLEISGLQLGRHSYPFVAVLQGSNGSTLVSRLGHFTFMGEPLITIEPFTFVFQRLPYSWSIRRAGQPVTCMDVGAARFEITFAVGITTLGFTINCPAFASSQVLQPATYSVNARLLDSADAPIATWTSPSPLTITTTTGGVLSPITFDVN